MKLLIEITENNYKEMCEHGIERVDFDIQRMMKNATPIPDNVTRAEAFEIVFGAKIDPKHGDYDLFCFAHTGCSCGDCPLTKIRDEDRNKWCSTAFITWWESPFAMKEKEEETKCK